MSNAYVPVFGNPFAPQVLSCVAKLQLIHQTLYQLLLVQEGGPAGYCKIWHLFKWNF